MTDKELKLMDYVISAIGSIHDSIAEADVRPLANALRKLTAMQILIEAPVLNKPLEPLEYETPEQPKIDQTALDIIREPIADEVPMETGEEKPKKNTGHRLTKEEKDQIRYMLAQKIAAVCIAEKVGCSVQTVMNIKNEVKKAEQERLKREVLYKHPEGGKQ